MRPGRVLIAAVLGYAAGTFPSAAIAARLSGSGSDIFTAGSGNPGALNAVRELGRGWGSAVGVADIAKGTVAAWAGRRLGGDDGCYVAATTVVAGHMYPPLRRGGRGIATSFGATIVAFPLFAPVDFGVAALVIVLRRHAPQGTRSTPAVLASSSAFLAMSSLWAWKRWPNPGGPAAGRGLLAYALATLALVLPRWRP
ncbi:MAG TPA: glycerol-3-phosphate acyltransferase [Candidatus Dormibacteraeota bacterium]|nr:glycerol-3-phosphate acyltransferase [Candidatus Dormibacteraeota bacterium]